MSTTMKVSLLALVSSVAAFPHYGHGKFHGAKGTGAHGTGIKPYPTGGWESYNKTRVAGATGTGSYGDEKTTVVGLTSTTTVFSTVHVKPSPVSEANAIVQDYSQGSAGGQCGPATVTVTASEKVTITVTPGGGAASSSAELTTTSVVYATTIVQQTSTVRIPSSPPAQPSSSKVVASSVVQPPVYSAPAYSAPAASSAAPVYSAAPAPSSAAPSSAAPKPSGTGNTYSGAKRGLAYNDASLCKTFGSKFGFAYNWAQVENNDIGTQFIPLIGSPDKGSVSDWLANVDKAVAKGSKAVMGFNEPDISTQANMSPQAACSAWKQYLNPIASKHSDVTILGPSVSNAGQTGMGLDWLSQFKTACPDAIYHAINIHFYDVYDSNTITRFKAQVEKAISMFGLPVWITEFGLNDGSATQDQAASFLKDAMAYLDSNSNVQGYSWFMVGTGENQLNSGSGLSAVGQVYASGSY